MNCRYTEEELKKDVEDTIGIKAKYIQKIEFCGLWHIRFRAFDIDFYYWRADSDDEVHLKISPWFDQGRAAIKPPFFFIVFIVLNLTISKKVLKPIDRSGKIAYNQSIKKDLRQI